MFIWRNMPQAPIVVQKRVKDELQAAPEHPATALLKRPNPRDGGDMLVNMVAYSLNENGNAYILINYKGDGTPSELIWWPHNKVDIPPKWSNEIEEYILTDIRGTRIVAPAEDVIHLRFGIDPEDPRFGLAPLASVSRDAATLQSATTYRANILRNMGIPGSIISSKDSNVSINPKDLKDKFDAQSRGDAVGSTVVVDAMLDVHYPKASPQDMALDTLEDRPEANICALFGLPIQVVGLHGGRDSKTYANVGEAREQAWEECLMPLGSIIAAQLTRRLLPLYSKSVTQGEYEIGFDYSNVRSLQPDLDKLHQRARDDWNSGLLTLADWKRIVGMKPESGDEDIRKVNPGSEPDPVVPEPKQIVPPAKMESWDSRLLKELELHRGC